MSKQERTGAAATAPQSNIETISKGNDMNKTDVNKYEFDQSINLLAMSTKQFLLLIEAECEKAPSAVGVLYAARWALTRQLNGWARKLAGSVDFQLAEVRFNRTKLARTFNKYHEAAALIESMYQRFEQHADAMNAVLNKYDSMKSNTVTARNGNRYRREAFNAIEFHPFMSREENSGVLDIEAFEYDTDDLDPELEEERQHMEALAKFEREMAQNEKRYRKENVHQAMDSEPDVIFRAVSAEEWLDIKASRSTDELIRSAHYGAWAVLASTARKIVKDPYVWEIIKDRPLGQTKWDEAKGGKALSLAVTLKSRVVSGMNFIEAMEARREYMVNARLREEHEANGTIGESSLAVSGANYDESIQEIDDFIKEAEREVNRIKPYVARLYAVARRFKTVDDLPDYRTAFPREPGPDALPDYATVEKIEVDKAVKGQALKQPLWLVTAKGSVKMMRELAEACRTVRYEMFKAEQRDVLAALATDAKTSDESMTEAELNAMLDSIAI